MKRFSSIIMAFFAVLCAGFCVAAGAEDFPPALSKANDAAFSAVCARISSRAVTKGDFTQTTAISKMNRSISSSGNFIVSASDGIFWNTTLPFPVAMVMTKSAVVQVAPNGRRTVLAAGANAVFERFAAVLTSVFNGDQTALRENFDIFFSESAGAWNIGLVPKERALRASIERIQMTGADEIARIVLSQPGGDSVRYDFSNQTHAASLSVDERALFAQ